MTKRLTKHGNSLAAVIDRPILDLLGIDENTELDFSTDGKVLIMSPVSTLKHRKKVAAALEEVNKKYGRALKRLAE